MGKEIGSVAKYLDFFIPFLCVFLPVHPSLSFWSFLLCSFYPCLSSVLLFFSPSFGVLPPCVLNSFLSFIFVFVLPSFLFWVILSYLFYSSLTFLVVFCLSSHSCALPLSVLCSVTPFFSSLSFPLYVPFPLFSCPFSSFSLCVLHHILFCVISFCYSSLPSFFSLLSHSSQPDVLLSFLFCFLFCPSLDIFVCCAFSPMCPISLPFLSLLGFLTGGGDCSGFFLHI